MTTSLARTRPAAVLAHRTASPLEALAVAWLLGYANERTRRAYRRDLEHFVAWCQAQDLDPLAVRRPHVDAYAQACTADGLAPSSLARRLSALSSFYAYAVDEDALPRNPVSRVRRPAVSVDDSATVGLTRDDARRLLAAAAAHSPRTGALVALLLANGLRIGEALGADVEDLGTARGHRTLTVTRKGGRRVTVPLAPATLAALELYLQGRSSGPLFPTSTGRRLDAPAAFRLVRRLALAAGVENAGRLSPHSLRHAAITAALDAGVSLRDVQDFAGHADPRTTRRYDRARHSLDRHATYAVAAYLGDPA